MTTPIKQHYDTYHRAFARKEFCKAQIVVLKKQGEQASRSAWKNTDGTIQEKSAAAQSAWSPINAQIAALESEIARLDDVSDAEFDLCWGIK